MVGLEPDGPFARVLAGQQPGQPGGPDVGGFRGTATFASGDGDVSESIRGRVRAEGLAVSISATPSEARSHGDDAPSQLVRWNSTLSAFVFTSATLHPAAIQDRVALSMPGP